MSLSAIFESYQSPSAADALAVEAERREGMCTLERR
jgi:hypothetical protein